MARVKSTTHPVDGGDRHAMAKVALFECRITLVEEGDFDTFEERGWLHKEHVASFWGECAEDSRRRGGHL